VTDLEDRMASVIDRCIDRMETEVLFEKIPPEHSVLVAARAALTDYEIRKADEFANCTNVGGWCASCPSLHKVPAYRKTGIHSVSMGAKCNCPSCDPGAE
jgi:hypothetical protein